MKYITKAFLPCLFLCFLLSSCGFEELSAKTKNTFALDTAVSITYYFGTDEPYITKALKKVSEYEKIFSRTDEESELYRINNSEERVIKISDELYSLLDTALMYCEISEGKFDITLGAVNELYDFSSETFVPPSEEELAEALKKTGYETLTLKDGMLIRENPDVIIDLGAIAKGYIGDRIKEYLVENGVKNAIINLGGNIILIGRKPERTLFKTVYRDYTVGIQEPVKGSANYILTLSLSGSCLVTSGTYQRCFTYNGELYHHILDSSSGLPVKNGYSSVSIVSSSSTDADALSTLFFILGPEESKALAKKYSLNLKEAVFIDENKEIEKITFNEK